MLDSARLQYINEIHLEQEITASRARWVKPVEQYTLVLQFGRNIVATEGK